MIFHSVNKNIAFRIRIYQTNKKIFEYRNLTLMTTVFNTYLLIGNFQKVPYLNKPHRTHILV